MDTTYKFPYWKNEDGTPRIEREMTPEQYEQHKQALAKVFTRLKYDVSTLDKVAISNWIPASVNLEMLEMVYQNSDYCDNINYPCKAYPERTFKTSGNFPIIVYSVLKYFKRDVTLEGLRDIAVYGDYHHENGTWHHYVDVVCQTYNLSVSRLDSFARAYLKVHSGSLVLALMNNKIFSNAKGNALVMITGFFNGEVAYYYPGNARLLGELDLNTFMENCNVLWGIDNY